MSNIDLQRLSTAYPRLLKHVLKYGDETESRIGKTKEIVGFNLQLHDPCHCVVKRPHFSDTLMHAECAMILGGVFDEDLVTAVSPKVADLVGAATAYGPRIGGQLRACVQELKRDKGSRRAVVYVGNSMDLVNVHSNSSFKAEMPCTCTMQFLIRDQRLHMMVTMRSWDLVWGMSYDIPMFVGVQIAMSRDLDVHMGSYHHFAGSAHIYEQHWGVKAEENTLGLLQLKWIGDSLDETSNGAMKQITRLRRKAGLKVA